MERPELTLVTAEPAPPGRPAAVGLAAMVLAAAALATAFGADAARRPLDTASLAESALARTLSSGDPAPAREAEERLRARLRRIPLDAASRTIAASLLAETATTAAERAAAADQASAATRLVRTDEWISHSASLVLARCGRSDLALSEVARMFEYAPDEAAAALFDVEPFVPEERLEDGLPPSPAAWLAWAARLRLAGREDAADARLAALLTRWPGDLAALRAAASVAAGRDRIEELTRLVPPSLALPETQEAAALHAYRARTKAATGDPSGSRADAARAVALSNNDPWVLVLAGDALAQTEPALARDYWTRALFGLPSAEATRGGAIWIRVRLARLDEREGRAGDALRAWRGILGERPDDGEAKRRIAELTGATTR